MVSAVTFATATAFLDAQSIGFRGYMVAVRVALIEPPAIIAGLILIRLNQPKNAGTNGENGNAFGHVLRKAFFNGSVFLLVGSLVIGYLSREAGEAQAAQAWFTFVIEDILIVEHHSNVMPEVVASV